eukprot:3685226-Alexandrium_andersonii.AAC.1
MTQFTRAPLTDQVCQPHERQPGARRHSLRRPARIARDVATRCRPTVDECHCRNSTRGNIL